MDSFYTAYPLIDQLYGVEVTPEWFEEIGLIAWNKIGNKITRLYRYRKKLEKDEISCSYFIELPCNCDIIESVTYDSEDWNYTSNKTLNGDISSQFTENYIEGRKIHSHPLYEAGKYAKYEQVGDTLYFDRDYGYVTILYKGVILDEEELPYITDKEALAIATYCAMNQMRKIGFKTMNNVLIQQSQLLQQEWLKLCSNARVPININQNEMNEILDAQFRFDRKRFNKSFKPII